MAAPGLEMLVLYDGVAQPWFSALAVRDYLAAWLPWLALELRPDPLRHALAAVRDEARREEATAGLAEELCHIRVKSPAQPVAAARRRLLGPELDFEARLLRGVIARASGVVYDGLELQRLAFNVLPHSDRHLGAIHIWFTQRLIATWDEDERRYHARVSVYGFPAIISTSGMAEAPAREREHHLARRLGVPMSVAGATSHLTHEDPRATDVAKGYAMQAVFYALTGEPFCDDPHCRLFNAHWQRELLVAQLGGTDYCPRHADMLHAWQEQRAPKEALT